MDIGTVVDAYANVLYNLFGFYYNTSFNVNAGIYLSYNVSGIISLEEAINRKHLGNIIFNETAAGECHSTFALDKAFNQSDTFPLCNLFSWLFLVWKGVTLYDLGLHSDPAGGINIFVNDTALKSYADYFNNFISLSTYNYPLKFEVLELSEKNRLQFLPSTFDQRYWCMQRHLKDWLSLVISVLASDVAFMFTAYQLFTLVAGWIQTRRDGAGNMNV
jgi:hypothetical protein